MIPTWLLLSPLLTAAITTQPATGDRAVRGAEILISGKVHRLADDRHGADHWLVYGSAAQPYAVSVEEGRCNCPDSKRPCKHIHAARFALALGIQPPDPDADLWSPVAMTAGEMLDAEIQAKLDELIAAGVEDDADLLVIGDWVWIVGNPDPALMDALQCRWHDRRNCHYWRPIWASVEAYNENAGLPELAQKYGIKRQIARRGQSQPSATDLALMLIPKLNRDADGELWA